MTDICSAMLTDLYELTMAAAYFANGRRQTAVFELFVRSLPVRRSHLVVAGLEQAVAHLGRMRFRAVEIEYLRRLPTFRHVGDEFFKYLEQWRFRGDIEAMPEGTVAFAMEPLVRVRAPILDAQLVETVLLASINFPTLIASKAARVVHAAQGRPVIEFGARRAHGLEAGLLAARAAYIGGCAGSSLTAAGQRFGVPVFGTLAHSYVMSFPDELAAFAAFLQSFPDTATLLLDTYDTVAAARAVARRFGPRVPAVRLDSGDFLDLSKAVRRVLDEAGLSRTRIFASGDLNEDRIHELLDRGAPIDAFGVGTELSTSADAPFLGGVYKLVEYDGKGCIKLSAAKRTYPWAKQVWRSPGVDVISAAGEPPPAKSAQPLLVPVMRQGEPIAANESLEQMRARTKNAVPHRVRFSPFLEQERQRLEGLVSQAA